MNTIIVTMIIIDIRRATNPRIQPPSEVLESREVVVQVKTEVAG